MYRTYAQKFGRGNGNMGCAPSQEGRQHNDGNTEPKGKAVTTASTTAPEPSLRPGPLAKTNNGGESPQVQSGPTVPARGKIMTEAEKAKHRAALEEKKKLAEDLKKKLDETMALLENLAVPKGATLIANNAINGNMDMECPSPAKIVRIFTSSTFTDTKQERNILMKYAYPKIKEHCRKLGYEFQVVDMRWGIRDEATDDHMTTELCLKELKLCQKLSTGPNFVSLLSHKYGYTPFPRVIEAEEFEAIFTNIEKPETKALLKKWYTRDDNAVPAAYILSSISTHIPDFISEDNDKKAAAKNQWWEESQQMQEGLELTAMKIFDEEKARKYIMSVTETETEEGLKPKEAEKNFLWLNRNIEDIETQESSYALSRYIECLGPEEKVKKSRQLLKELKEDKLKRKLDPNKILNYSVNWSQTGGIDPDKVEEHKKYLELMCKDFVTNMTDMIDKSIAEKENINDPLVDECLQHIRFCQTKCEGFAGQKDILEKIKTYVTSNQSGQPFVLHGPSGTGKTSIMAMAAKMAKTWINKQAVVILRFLGTTPESSNLMSLLHSICVQIRRAYKLPPLPRMQNITMQIADFKALLIKGRPNQPLLIFLDSLDQLDPAYDARQMDWLYPKVTTGTRVVLSTLPEPVYQCFPALQTMIKMEENLVKVPVLDKTDVGTILSNWLKMRERKLTDKQMEVILQAFDKCPTPLFLKLSFEESTSWTSFHPLEKTVLQMTVRSSIEHLFERLEKLHGKILVSRALAYLTLTHNGASEAELEDILSCDDDVLNDVYMYWTPPMRRLPPLLLVRIRNDLNQYLVERGADGTRVLYWYHRQFIEAAEARYCSDRELNRLIHANLADFFNGTWASGKMKPYTTSKGVKGEEDRHVSAQPLKFGEKDYNLRALSNLPYHRIKAGQVKLLEEQCLANIHFLLCKVSAMPLSAILADFSGARESFPDNSLSKFIHEALLLSQKGIVTDPGQIVPQLIGRLDENDVTRKFLDQCRTYPKTFIEPTKLTLEKPGGQLVHCISAHKSDIDMMDMTTNGKLVVSVCQSDREIKIWDIQAGKLKRNVVTGHSQYTTAYFCHMDQWLVCEKNKTLSISEVETGNPCSEVTTPAHIRNVAVCVAGKNKDLLLLFSNHTVLVHDLGKDGQLIKTVEHPEKMKFGTMSIPYGTEHYVALCDDNQYFVTVLDLKSMTFRKKFRGFEKVPTDDGDFDEHEVEGLVIHPNETQLIYTTMFTSEIVFADFDGNRLRNIPGDEDKTYRSLDITPDGQCLYVQEGNAVLFFDIGTLEHIDTIEHQKDVVAVKTRDMKTVVTLAEDSNLRIWDRTKSKHTKTEEVKGDLMQIKIKEMCPLPSSRYMLVIGRMPTDNDGIVIGVYDFLKEIFVRKRTMTDVDIKLITVLDTKRVVFRIERKLYRFNLETLEIDLIFQGFTCNYKSDFTATKRNELVGCSRGEKNLKVFDLNTGKVSYILKAGQNKKIDVVVVNDSGTVACAQTEEGPLVLYDLVGKSVLYTIDSKPAYSEYFGNYMYINEDGTKLLFDIDQTLPGIPKGDDVAHFVAWDIQNRKEMFRLYDLPYEKKYKILKNDESTSVEESPYRLDGGRVMTTCFDNVLRVYDINTGKLLNRLEGHTTSVKVALNENAPYILTYGQFDEEDCIRIWDKTTCKQIATYSLDKTISNIHWSKCGRFFYTSTSTSTSANITRWVIHHGHPHVSNVDIDSIPEDFSLAADLEPLKLDLPKYDQKNFVPEEGDPDTDPEIISDDDDDDDDDDE